ncbi:MAG: sugar phosphate isomerase/epimerase [Sphingomonadales bacterium]|nr:sugar phosphate isomerase/epimerase [Sphingomonadales bacterium]
MTHTRFGIELLTVLGMNPVDHVRLAAELGCSNVSMGLMQMPFNNPYGHASWSLAEDPALRRELKAALADTGVFIAIGEGIRVRDDAPAAASAAQMDLMAELGARRINAVSMDYAEGYVLEQMAALRAMAAARGMAFSIEFVRGWTIGTLAQGVAAAKAVGGTVLIDSMHFYRGGGQTEQIAALDPAMIGHCQISDVPMNDEMDYMQQAMVARRAPGDGELPLRDFVAALPADMTIGIEVPNLAMASDGRPQREVVAEIVRKAQALEVG